MPLFIAGVFFICNNVTQVYFWWKSNYARCPPILLNDRDGKILNKNFVSNNKLYITKKKWNVHRPGWHGAYPTSLHMKLLYFEKISMRLWEEDHALKIFWKHLIPFKSRRIPFFTPHGYTEDSMKEILVSFFKCPFFFQIARTSIRILSWIFRQKKNVLLVTWICLEVVLWSSASLSWPCWSTSRVCTNTHQHEPKWLLTWRSACVYDKCGLYWNTI